VQIGNGAGALLEQWGYTAPLQRLTRLRIGASLQAPSSVFDRAYAYDSVGNVTQISNSTVIASRRSLVTCRRMGVLESPITGGTTNERHTDCNGLRRA